MIFPYVMEGESSFYFLNIIRTIRILTKIVIYEKIVMRQLKQQIWLWNLGIKILSPLERT